MIEECRTRPYLNLVPLGLQRVRFRLNMGEGALVSGCALLAVPKCKLVQRTRNEYFVRTHKLVTQVAVHLKLGRSLTWLNLGTFRGVGGRG